MKRATLSAAFLGLAASLGTWSAAAQDNCAPLRDLVTIPSIESQKGLLKGLIILAHEDRGMMQLIQVVDPSKNHYNHH